MTATMMMRLRFPDRRRGRSACARIGWSLGRGGNQQASAAGVSGRVQLSGGELRAPGCGTRQRVVVAVRARSAFIVDDPPKWRAFVLGEEGSPRERGYYLVGGQPF